MDKSFTLQYSIKKYGHFESDSIRKCFLEATEKLFKMLLNCAFFSIITITFVKPPTHNSLFWYLLKSI